VAGIVVAVGLDRIYSGTHWPSDVLAGLLIAVAWLAFVLSLRRVTDRAFATAPPQADKSEVQHAEPAAAGT
jgi:undecaprenyl-diphosphatase